ncbi:hypothetical protein ACU55K_000943 [Listeria monocytogenes]
MRKTFLILTSFTIFATLISLIFSNVYAEQSTSWLEQELDGNEPFINAVERRLNKSREEVTLQDLESMTTLDVENASSFPEKITDFKNLTTLTVQMGTITEVPDNLAELKKLLL